jgi:phosphatidylglycerol:prolipoprotein diacylglycerol transferase
MNQASDYFIVDFDPVVFKFNLFGWEGAVHWYGLMYLVSFVVGWLYARHIAKKEGSGWTTEQIDDMLFYIGVGTILGGRLGYLLFYDLENIFAQDSLGDALWHMVSVWKGGMSFHGGLIGVVTAIWLFSRKYKKPFGVSLDFMAALAPIGLFFGRIGNFINGELWGKASTLPWAMIFPDAPKDAAGHAIPRHPSPLYEAMLEGLVLFALLYWFTRKPRPVWATAGLFGIGYAVSRILIEFVRIPDVQLGYLAFGWLTMGQLLSIPLLVAGILLMLFAYNKLFLQNTNKHL